MKTITKYFFISIVMLFCSLAMRAGIVDSTSVVESNNYVLILNAHLENIQWKNNYEDLIIESLHDSKIADVYTEHIKTLDLNNENKLEEYTKSMFRKYKNRPRLVVFIGPAPKIFFAKSLNEHWNDIPMLDCFHQNTYISSSDFLSGNISSFSKITNEELKRKYNITGISSNSFIKETVELMKEVIPDLNHILYVSDERIGSAIEREKVNIIMKKYFPTISVEMLESKDYSTTELLKRLNQYNSNTGLLFLNWALKGSSAEDYYEWNNLYKLLSNTTKIPVFSTHDMNVEDGSIAGGYFVTQTDLSNEALNMMNLILNGKSPRDIPFVSTDKMAHPYLNYQNLSTYKNIDINYPDDATYFQKPIDSLQKYKYYIIAAIFVIICIVIFMLQRIILLGRQRKIELEKNKKERLLNDEIRKQSYKLAMSLETSTVVPWVWNIVDKTFTWDKIKEVEDGDRDRLSISSVISWDDFLSLVVEEDRKRMENLFLCMKNGRANYMKEECRMVSGKNSVEVNWYMFRAVIYERDNIGRPLSVIGTRMLITESKELEIELRDARDKAEEANRLKTAFLANISHEIRTPLNAIVGFSGVLANTDDMSEKQELAEVVKHNNKLLLHLINDIVDISKLEADAVEFNYVNEDANKVIDEMVETYKNEVDKEHVQVIGSKPMDLCEIKMEKRRLTQILDNFMSNAAKFTHAGYVEVGYYKPENGLIRFYVKDTGCGIMPDQLKLVFGRFVKLNNFEQGTGLGLSVCELLAKKLGGEVGVYSKYRSGSEFWFDMPYREASENEEPTGKKYHDKVRILVAEDINSNFVVLKSMLHGYELIHAWNGKEAVEMYRKYKPQVVLMDVKMPVMDGYAATAEIKKINPKASIIALTAYAFDDDSERMLEKGFNGYEAKPINRSSLEKKINNFLNKDK